MKQLFFTLILLMLSFSVYSQRYFSANYQRESNNMTADGVLTLEFHNHYNPILYLVTLSNSFTLKDTVLFSDSIPNIYLNTDVVTSSLNDAYESYSAYALDIVTQDTLGFISGFGSSVNSTMSNVVFDFDSVTASSTYNSCDGSFALTNTTISEFGGLSSPVLYYSSQYSNDLSNMSALNLDSQTFDTTNLCYGYYQFSNGNGFRTSFYIDSSSSGVVSTPIFDVNAISIDVESYIECYSRVTASVNSNTGPFYYSWNGSPFVLNDSTNSFCSEYVDLKVANSLGDTVDKIFYVDNVLNLSAGVDFGNCGAEAKLDISISSPFQVSWDGGPYGSSMIASNLCEGYHFVSLVDSIGDTMRVDFSINLFSIFINTFADTGNCTGGVDLFYDLHSNYDSTSYSYDGSPFVELQPLFSDYSQCEGIHEFIFVSNQDTIYTTIGVPSESNTYQSVSLTGTPVNDRLSLFYESCNVDYTIPVDSINLTHSFLDSLRLSFTFLVWQAGDSTIISDTIALSNQLSGLNRFTLTLYCHAKSSSKVIKMSTILDVDQSQVTLIEESNKIESQIYPNPFSNIINIKVEDFKSVTISDFEGRSVYTGLQSKINLSNLSSGIYLIKVVTENGTLLQKIIKE